MNPPYIAKFPEFFALSRAYAFALFAILLPEEMLEVDNTFVIVCSVIAVLANPVCELLIAKQSKWNFIVSVLVEITEILIRIIYSRECR